MTKKQQNQKNNNEQQKQFQMQLLNQQIQQYHQRINAINQQIQQLNDLVSNLENFKKSKKDSEMMFTLGLGVYGKGTLKDNNLLVNVGSNIVVQKSVQDTITIIKEQIQELTNILEEDEKTHFQLHNQLHSLQ